MSQFPQLPDFEVLSLLGQGAMGSVYRARRTSTGEVVALKSIVAANSSAQRALMNEFEVLSQVEHRYLINEREIVQHGDAIFLVMEYFDGQTLTQWIASHPSAVRWQRAAEILTKVGEALAYLHSQRPPVIVRDLKPDNLLLSEQGDLRLIDFGIARELKGSAQTEVALKGFASQSYAPLEQYTAQATTTPASDIYALGATTYHLLTGEPPPSAIDLVTQGQTAEQLLLDKGVPAPWAVRVGRAMASKAPQRCSLEEFLDGLQEPKASGVSPLPDKRGLDVLVVLAVALVLTAYAVFLKFFVE